MPNLKNRQLLVYTKIFTGSTPEVIVLIISGVLIYAPFPFSFSL